MKVSGLLKSLDYLFVLRPTLFFPLWTMVLAGHRLAGSGSHLSKLEWVLLCIGFSAMFGLVYLINQVKDKETDRENEKLKLVSDGLVTRTSLRIEFVILLATVPAVIIIAGHAYLLPWILIMFLVAGLLYNFTPVALQNHPLGSVISCVSGGWLLLELGQSLSGGEAGLLKELPYIIAFATAGILTSLPDVKGDKVAGKRTFSVVFGQERTILFGLIGLVTTLIISIFTRDLFIAAPALVSATMMFNARLSKDAAIAVRANKVAIFLLSVTIGLSYPVYLAIILIYFPLARWYHRARLSMIYPSFSE